jgi:4-hydroxybenzoate polyprenyltransferase
METSSKEDISALAVSAGGTRQLKASVEALRPHQWSKNLLIFMPLLLSHQFQTQRLLAAFEALIAFSSCASAFYIVNDLLDIEADHAHPRKVRRPFASGRLSAQQGLVLAAACLGTAITVVWQLPFSARIVLLIYGLLNLAYSVKLKQILFVDVIVLAIFYSLRLLFGGAAEDIKISLWTLTFCGFLFSGLAFVKRWTELVSLQEGNGANLARRGYFSSHLTTVRRFAQCSLCFSVIVLAFYINTVTASKLYRHPQVLWLLCVLLFVWIRRLVVITDRGMMTDDPAVFAFRDQGSQAIAGLAVVFGVLATCG